MLLLLLLFLNLVRVDYVCVLLLLLVVDSSVLNYYEEQEHITPLKLFLD